LSRAEPSNILAEQSALRNQRADIPGLPLHSSDVAENVDLPEISVKELLVLSPKQILELVKPCLRRLELPCCRRGVKNQGVWRPAATTAFSAHVVTSKS
jgi:hypothetical protein